MTLKYKIVQRQKSISADGTVARQFWVPVKIVGFDSACLSWSTGPWIAFATLDQSFPTSSERIEGADGLRPPYLRLCNRCWDWVPQEESEMRHCRWRPSPGSGDFIKQLRVPTGSIPLSRLNLASLVANDPTSQTLKSGPQFIQTIIRKYRKEHKQRKQY